VRAKSFGFEQLTATDQAAVQQIGKISRSEVFQFFDPLFGTCLLPKRGQLVVALEEKLRQKREKVFLAGPPEGISFPITKGR
jgi:hypothetical protein